jgi:putative ABC transport system permease protein
MLDSATQYLRYAVRSLRRSPAFTVITVLTLGIGTGATTAIFSVVSTALLQPLPYPNAKRLVAVQETRGSDEISVSHLDFRDWQDRAHAFQGIAAFYGQSFTLTGVGESERIRGAVQTANLFPILGILPIRGRLFTSDEDQPGGPRVVAISFALWTNRFGADPHIIGRSIQLDGEAHTIIAVMPKRFRFPDGMIYDPADLWLPMSRLGESDRNSRDSHPGLVAVGLLKPGMDLTAGRSDLVAIAANLRTEFPGSNRNVGVRVRSALDQVTGDLRSALVTLMAAVGLLLLIACANVAALVLARATARRRELAIRSALGAGWRHVTGQLLSEGLLLALAGGVAGAIIAILLTRIGGPLISDLPRLETIHFDWRALLFLFAAIGLTGTIFGLLPTVRFGRGGRSDWLGLRGASANAPSTRARRILVVGEIALTLLMLIGAGALLTSLKQMLADKGGIDARGVFVFTLRLPEASYGNDQLTPEFYQTLLERMKSLPGVSAAGAVSLLPFSGSGAQSGIRPVEAPPVGESERSTDVQVATPEYFRAMGIELLRGRLFTDQDRPGQPPVALVDERLAGAFWPNENPIGHQVAGWGFSEITVVGVVRHVKRYGVIKESRQELYLPLAQRASSRMSIALRTRGDFSGLAASVRREVSAIDPNVAVYEARAMEDLVATTVAGPRLAAVLSGSFATMAFLLAIIGIYGLMAYIVTTRRREMGVRIALGAQSGRVVGMVMVQALRLAIGGIILGILAAIPATRLLRQQVYRAKMTDPVLVGALAVGLLIIAVLATLGPAMRAARTSPLRAFSEE